MIGRTVSHYRIVDRLGGGGMGEVYAADDEHLHRRVALKFLPRELSADPQAVERFQREARAASALTHAHICTIHDIGAAEDSEGVQHYIVMELLEGRNLRHLIDGRPLPIDTVLELGIQIADALDVAHAKGIVHRDVKPANVIVTERGDAKVLDFGVAKLGVPAVPGAAHDAVMTQLATMASREPLTTPGVAVGTIDYMSPEQARGEEVDSRTDLYSLGLVLYEMATGQPAVSGRTSALIFDAILHHTPTPPVRLNPQIPLDLERVIVRAIEKNKRLRYQTAADLSADLRRVKRLVDSGAVASSDTPAAPQARARTQGQKHKRPARSKSSKSGVSGPRTAAGARPGTTPSGVTEIDASAVATPTVSPSSRLRRGLLWAAAVLILGATAGLFYFIGSRESPATGIGASGRPAVAVVRFENPGGDQSTSWLTTGLPGMLVTGLGQTPGLDIVGNQRIDEILKDLGGPEGGRLDASRVLDVGRRAGAGAIVVGNIFKTGSEIRIDAQVQDVASGRLLAAHSVRGADVFALADDLTRQILNDLNVSSADRARGVSEVTSTSTEAYRLYSEGQRTARLLRRPEARKLLEAAVGIDPTFAAAWLELSAVAASTDDYAAEARYRQKVVENLNRLSDRQRLAFEAGEASRAGKADQTIQSLEKLIARYPDEASAYLGLVGTYRNSGDSAKALESIERGIKALPQSGSLRNTYGYILLDAGRYPEALREFETYARLEPNEPNPYDSQAEVYIIMSQPERALERYAKVLEIDRSFSNAHVGRAWAFGMLGRFDDAMNEMAALDKAMAAEGSPTIDVDALAGILLTRAGRYREAEARFKNGIAAAKKFEATWSAVLFPFLQGLTSIERGDLPGALADARRMEQAMDSSPAPVREAWSVAGSLLAGVVDARAGRLDNARDRLARQRRVADLRRTWENWSVQTLEGEIAFAAGDLAAAEKAFAAAEPPLKMFFSMGAPSTSLARNSFPFRDGTARVLNARRDVNGAIDAYRRLLTLDLSQKWTAILEPRLVLQLARLLEQQGDRPAARKEYQRFLDLWQRADTGLPELTEARGKVR